MDAHGEPVNMTSNQQQKRESSGPLPWNAVGLCFAMQPMVVGKILVQVKYEPLEPEFGKSLIRRTPGYYYPNMFRYLNHIRKEKGWTALWKGVTPKLAGTFLGVAIEQKLSPKIKSLLPYKGEDANLPITKKHVTGLLYEIGVDCLSKTVSIVFTQPLTVVMVRTICSLVNNDEAYSSLWSTVKEIYNTEGFAGFFNGFAPRWLAEIIAITVGYSLVSVFHRILEFLQVEDIERNAANVGTLVQYGVSTLTYKFTLISTIAAATCPGLHLGMPVYTSWRDIYADLKINGTFKVHISNSFKDKAAINQISKQLAKFAEVILGCIFMVFDHRL